jgi:hypothetical protein
MRDDALWCHILDARGARQRWNPGAQRSAWFRRKHEKMSAQDDDLGRRAATRYIVRIPVTLRVGTSESAATLVDVSDSGARVDCPPPRLSPGTSVSVELPWFDSEDRISMLAKFVRDTPTGCALRFVDPDPFLRLFVKLARLNDGSVSERVEKMFTEF